MRFPRGASRAAVIASCLLAGCWSAPPPPSDTPSDFAWAAPLDLGVHEGGFFRFNIPDSAPEFSRRRNEPEYFGAYSRIAVFDANGRSMRCGGFDREDFAEGYAEGASSGIVFRGVTQSVVPRPLAREAARVRLCTNEQGAISTFCKIEPAPAAGEDGDFYVADFDATGAARRFQISIEWSAPPAGGTVDVLRFLGESTPQPIKADANSKDASLQSVGAPFESPLIFRTRGTPPGFVPQRVLVKTALRRADRLAHWFEASGTPPYRLLIDEHNGSCTAHDIGGIVLPAVVVDPDWPPEATAGTVTKNERSMLGVLRAGIAPEWRIWVRVFVGAYAAGLIMALAYRFLHRGRA
ncbi:MAG TPA: hypothetical protein VKB52_02970 [Rhodanobacteraceae bacterium]|nr:hypothetical protein [Rhodanobacteraceae bacterium]